MLIRATLIVAGGILLSVPGAVLAPTDAQATTVYSGYIPNNAELIGTYDDYTTSPSGTYFGILDALGDFAVFTGSSPIINSSDNPGINILSNTSGLNLGGGYFVHMQTDGNFVVYTSASGFDMGTVVPVAATNTNGQGSPPYYAEITDNGNFVIGEGTDPAHSTGTIYSQNGANSAVSQIQLTGITYDFSDATFTGTTSVEVGSTLLQNPTNKPQQGDATVTTSYTQSNSLSFAVANSVGVTISSSATVGVPGLFSSSLQVGITESTTVTDGQAMITSHSVWSTAGLPRGAGVYRLSGDRHRHSGGLRRPLYLDWGGDV